MKTNEGGRAKDNKKTSKTNLLLTQLLTYTVRH